MRRKSRLGLTLPKLTAKELTEFVRSRSVDALQVAYSSNRQWRSGERRTEEIRRR